MGGGMNEEQLRKFVGYFMESLDPSVYYEDLIRRRPEYLSAMLTIDINHQVVNAEGFLNQKDPKVMKHIMEEYTRIKKCM